MKLKKNNFILPGFTMAETLVNLLIISAVSLSMMILFYQIKDDYSAEMNRTDAINYANRALDELVYHLKTAYHVEYDASLETKNLEFSYPQYSDSTVLIRIKNDGFFRVIESGREVPLVHGNYIPNDLLKRPKYQISNIEFIDDVNPQVGWNWQNEATQNAREAAYVVNLDMDIYDTDGFLIDKIKFERKIFSPSKFVNLFDEGLDL